MDKTDTKNKYDLEERTAVFGENVIGVCKGVGSNEITKSLISQLVRSATSIGANYLEANGASSKKDFKHKISLCKKESQETRHWCRMLKNALTAPSKRLDDMVQESKELAMIFHAIISKC